MKAFYVTWNTNYGHASAIVYTLNMDKCKEICEVNVLIWSDYNIQEIDKDKTKEEIIFGI